MVMGVNHARYYHMSLKVYNSVGVFGRSEVLPTCSIIPLRANKLACVISSPQSFVLDDVIVHSKLAFFKSKVDPFIIKCLCCG